MTARPSWRVDPAVEWALDAMRVSAATHLLVEGDHHELLALSAQWRHAYELGQHHAAEAERARAAAAQIFEERGR